MNDTQFDGLLSQLEHSVGNHLGPVAVGLDMAASETGWGLCVLLIDKDLASACLSLLLPQARLKADGTPAKNLLCRARYQAVESTLRTIHKHQKRGAMAVDIPFGWPSQQRQFLKGWSASSGWSGTGPMPHRDCFERRWCDRELQERYDGVRPLSVGADKIAQAAYRWAAVRGQLGGLVGAIDYGFGTGPADFSTFETYPAAFVRLFTTDSEGYKSRPKVRPDLLKSLRADYPLGTRETEDGWLEWACGQKGSPDALDGFLCALTAWDYLRWQRQPISCRMTTPQEVLRRDITDDEHKLIRDEGWILVRDSRSDAPSAKGTVK